MPVDTQKIHCDFLTATGRKFLRGPRGTGFLYVSDRVLEEKYYPLIPDMRGAKWVERDTYRLQAGARSRVIVQKESHLYNDSGDCAQVLSNLNLIPLAPSGGTFTLEEVESAISRADGGRVTTGVGVISIESPIRRLLGKQFDYGELKRVCAFARSEGIATHLDGARLFMAAGYRVAETPVRHRPRLKGTSKYGAGINNRLWVGLADLAGVYWLRRRALPYHISETMKE